MTNILNQVLSVPGTIASGVTSGVVAAKNTVSNAVIQSAISGISSAISASTSGISKAVEVKIVNPSIIAAAAAVKKAAVVANPYVTGLAGIAGTTLVAKGAYTLYQSEGKDKRAKAELAAGLTGVAYAAARVAIAYMPAMKDQDLGNIKNSSAWWVIPATALSTMSIGFAGIAVTYLSCIKAVGALVLANPF